MGKTTSSEFQVYIRMAEVEVQAPSLKDHPKLLPHLKDHLHNFDTKALTSVEMLHKDVLPSAEIIAIEKQRAVLHSHLVTFDTTELRTVEVQHKVILPTAEIIAIEKQREVLHSHLVTFDTTELKTVEVQHKVILPTAEMIALEREVL